LRRTTLFRLVAAPLIQPT